MRIYLVSEEAIMNVPKPLVVLGGTRIRWTGDLLTDIHLVEQIDIAAATLPVLLVAFDCESPYAARAVSRMELCGYEFRRRWWRIERSGASFAMKRL